MITCFGNKSTYQPTDRAIYRSRPGLGGGGGGDSQREGYDSPLSSSPRIGGVLHDLTPHPYPSRGFTLRERVECATEMGGMDVPWTR